MWSFRGGEMLCQRAVMKIATAQQSDVFQKITVLEHQIDLLTVMSDAQLVETRCARIRSRLNDIYAVRVFTSVVGIVYFFTRLQCWKQYTRKLCLSMYDAAHRYWDQPLNCCTISGMWAQLESISTFSAFNMFWLMRQTKMWLDYLFI